MHYCSLLKFTKQNHNFPSLLLVALYLDCAMFEQWSLGKEPVPLSQTTPWKGHVKDMTECLTVLFQFSPDCGIAADFTMAKCH